MKRLLVIVLFTLSTLTFAESKDLFSYETVKVADGIYAFISRGPGLGLVSGNSVAIIGEDGVLVVDSGQFPSLTRRMIAEIRSWTNKPVRVLVNTHWHGDHNTGNAIYQQEFPNLAILSTPETRVRFADMRQKFLVSKQMAEFGPVVRKALSTDKGPDGSALSPAARSYFEGLVKEIDFAEPDLKDVKDVEPNQTFENKVSYFLGNREVDVLFLGRGNTAGDAVVYVPDAKVLITGDLDVSPTPYAIGSFIGEWIDTMRKVHDIDCVAIVPGHGEVQHDKRYMEQITELLESVNSQVRQAVAQGLSLEDTRKKIDLSNLQKQFAGDDPRLNKNFDNFFVQPGVKRAYREAKEGKLTDEN